MDSLSKITMNNIYIFIAAFAVMLVSLAGIFTTAKVFKEWSERNLKYMATFATGVFIVVAYNLITEVTHSGFSPAILVGSIIGGAVIAWLLDSLMPGSHHHHDTEGQHSHNKAGARRIILSDILHNIADGFLVVPAFLVDVRLGLITTAGVLIHEVAQEISEYFVLKNAGYSTRKALTINFISSGSILIGVVMALVVSNISDDVIFGLLAVSAGIITYTIFKDLIPYSVKVAKSDRTFLKHATIAMAGIVIMGSLTAATASTHIHDHDEHDHEELHETHTHESEQGATNNQEHAEEAKHHEVPHTEPAENHLDLHHDHEHQ